MNKRVEEYLKLKKYKKKNRINIFSLSLLFCFNVALMHLDDRNIKEIYFDNYIQEADDGKIKTIEQKEFDTFKIKIGQEYSKEELSHIKKVEIDLINGMDYSYLNDMINLETLIINDYSTEPLLDKIDGKVFKNQMNIEIYRRDLKQSFTEEKYGFLKDIPYINYLKIGEPFDRYLTPDSINYLINESYFRIKAATYKSISFNIESKFLESLKNVHNLHIAIDEFFTYSYNDLSFLDSLYLDGKPYNVATFFDKTDLVELIKAGVDLKTNGLSEIIDISDKLDEAVKSLNLDNNESEIEKIDAALLYVINNCEYTDKKINSLFNLSTANEFYYNGFLRGALENDSQICGNYAALYTALLNRLDVNSYIMHSKGHAWNIVEYNNSYYYMDPTWIDSNRIYRVKPSKTAQIATTELDLNSSQIIEEHPEIKSYLDWYLFEPSQANIKDTSYHNPCSIPADIEKEIDKSKITMETRKVVEKSIFNTYFGYLFHLFVAFYSISYVKLSVKKEKYYKQKIKKLINTNEYDENI